MSGDVGPPIAYMLDFATIVPGDFVADRDSLPKVKMPHRDNFSSKEPRLRTAAVEGGKGCTDPKSVKSIAPPQGAGPRGQIQGQ